MSFEDFCDDVLNKSIGLLSANEIEQAQLAYQNWLKPNKPQPTKPDHPDMKKPLSALLLYSPAAKNRKSYRLNIVTKT